MALSITPVTILANKTAAASSSTTLTDCTAVAGSNVVALGVEVVMTFHNRAATVGVSRFAERSNYTTICRAGHDVPVAGSTVRHAFGPARPRLLRVHDEPDTGMPIHISL